MRIRGITEVGGREELERCEENDESEGKELETRARSRRRIDIGVDWRPVDRRVVRRC